MTEGLEANSVLQGMTITCPAGWRDKSMLVLSTEQPGPTGISANLVITHETMPGDLPSDPASRLEAFVDRQLDQMRDALPDFVEVSRRRVALANSAAELRIDWVSESLPISQWITYAPSENYTIIIATATAGRNDFANVEQAFRSMLQSFRVA